MAEVVEAVAAIFSLFNQEEETIPPVVKLHNRLRLSDWHETCSYTGMETNPDNWYFSTKVCSDEFKDWPRHLLAVWECTCSDKSTGAWIQYGVLKILLYLH